MHTRWSDLRTRRLSPEQLAEVDARVRAELARMPPSDPAHEAGLWFRLGAWSWFAATRGRG